MFLGFIIKFIYLNKCLICKRFYYLYIFRDFLLIGYIIFKFLFIQCFFVDYVINTVWCFYNNVDISLQAMDVFFDIGFINVRVIGGFYVIFKGYYNFLDLKIFIRKVCRLLIIVCIFCILLFIFYSVILILFIKLLFKVFYLRNKEIM